jgi:hypothetical protein
MTDDPTRTEPAYFGTPEQLLNALTEMQRRETRIQERAILCAALEALTEQLEATRADAKEAEAYAEELEAKLAEAVERLQFLAEALPELGALAAGTTKYDVVTLAIGEETMSLRFRDRGLAPKIPDEG